MPYEAKVLAHSVSESPAAAPCCQATRAEHLAFQSRSLHQRRSRSACAGPHKQLVNRLVEKHGFISVVVTATNWSNFFALRRHEGAQPEIRHLADLIWEAQQASTPKRLGLGEWHLPHVSDQELEAIRVIVRNTGDRCPVG